VGAAISSQSRAATGGPDLLPAIQTLVRERGLAAGDQLPSIRELAQLLGSKQTAVRDALLRAESLGLVTVLPRAGVFLAGPGEGPAPATRRAPAGDPLGRALGNGEPNVLDLLDARRLIEVELVGRAAERRRPEDLLPVRRTLDALLRLPADAARAEHVELDVRFHLEIARLAGNGVLCGLHRALMERLAVCLAEVPPPLRRRAQTDRSHVSIFQALVASDAEKARQEMRRHLDLAYDGLLKGIQEVPAVTAG
jgi:DNA-binding FadR family transcriptional regulator